MAVLIHSDRAKRKERGNGLEDWRGVLEIHQVSEPGGRGGRPLHQEVPGAAEDVAALDRVKVLRTIENLVAGAGSVAYLIESMHGDGPPTAQRIMIGRQGNVEGKVEKVKRLLGI